MTRSSIALATLVLVGSALDIATAAVSSDTDGLSAEERTKIDALFKEYDSATTPGCALGVMRNGDLAYARGYGMADLERRVPIAPTTLFDVGSTSKQFAAGAVLLLELDGKLALSDDVRKYLPELPDYGAPISIDHLMRHMSGLRDYNALLSLAGLDESVTDDKQALAVIARQRKINFPAGSRFEYSNTGYFLLSVIVQRVSGKSLADFARERIFLPLGMTRARFRDRFAMLIPDRALGYGADLESSDGKGGFRNAVSNWEQTGDGSLHLSIEEALKWDENFYQPRVGGHAFVERLQERGRLPNGEAMTYARGLAVDEYRGQARVHHAGAWIGYRSMLARFPEQHTSVGVFCNSEESDPTRLADQVADIVLADVLSSADPSPAAQQTTQQKGPAESNPHQRFLGSYFAAESDAGLSDTVLDVMQEKGALVLKVGSVSLPLTSAGPATFVVPSSPVRVEFSLTAPGPADALRLWTGGKTATSATRIVLATPSVVDLQAYVGTFYTPELDVTWPIVIDQGHLAVRRETRKFTAELLMLSPAMVDTFNGAHGLLRFTRDASGRVAGFDLSALRMHGIRFELRSRP